MAEMRLIVAGAGGRMGRTLVKAISDIKGFALAGVLEDTRSPLIGWDAGTLAGTPENGVKLTGDAAALIDKADGIVDFTAPVATVGFAELAGKSGKIHIIGTTGLSAADEARIKEAAVSRGGRAVTGGTDSGTRSEVPRRHVPSPGLLCRLRSAEDTHVRRVAHGTVTVRPSGGSPGPAPRGPSLRMIDTRS